MTAWTKTCQMRMGIAVVLACLTTPGVPAAEKKSQRAIIQIGLVDSIFRDVPDSMVKLALRPFRELMFSQTGLRGKLISAGDALTLGEQLTSNKLQLGVFHGFEFAWAQQKYPELRPLMIAVNHHRCLHAYILVKKDNGIEKLADLKGKKLAVPYRTREHCHLYLDHCCLELGKEAGSFFQIDTSSDVEAALNSVAEGRIDAVLVDGVVLGFYKKVHASLYRKLKPLKKSGVFPAAVVAYHAGAVNKKALHRFKTGMVKAKKSTRGQQLLLMAHMTGFEPVPADFQDLLDEVAKTYPAPQHIKVSKKQQAR